MKTLKNTFLLCFCFLSTVNVSSQNIDELNFLSSLPTSIQPDVLREIAAGEDTPDPRDYRGPRTTVEQLDYAIQRIRLQLNEIEQELSPSSQEPQELERFGSAFFTSFQSTFSPINLPNPSSGYILDVGDVLSFQMVGVSAKKDTDEYIIELDGSVNLPQLGKVFLAGLSFENANQLVKSKAESSLIGKKVFLTLTKLREINVFILGNAKFPGLYTLSGNSSVLSALNAAGGIDENGSYRNITHKRKNDTIGNFDLYDALIFGNILFNTQLRDGDVIIVNPAMSEASISGGVGREAIYEIYEEDTLADLIKYAGGITSSGQSSNVVIRRNNLTSNLENLVLPENFSNTKLLNGDSVRVGLFKPKSQKTFTVEIKGQVNKPGTYNIDDGEKLSSVIRRAGGYKKNAYPLGGKLFRESTKKVEEEIYERIYRELISFLVSGVQPSSQGFLSGNNGSLPSILAEFKDREAIGRVTTEFNLNKLNKDSLLDISLESGDIIDIPLYKSEVYVFGEVLNPGSKSYNPEFSPKDYINLSGGYARFASTDNVIVIHPNGDTLLLSDRFLFSRKAVEIYPGTIIYAPREVGKLDGVNYAAVIAPIFSSLALSLASLNSIND